MRPPTVAEEARCLGNGGSSQRTGDIAEFVDLVDD